MVGRRSGCFHGSEFNRKYDGQMDTNLRGGGCTKKGSETADMEMTEMLLKRAALRLQGEGGRRANKNTIVGVPEGGAAATVAVALSLPPRSYGQRANPLENRSGAEHRT